MSKWAGYACWQLPFCLTQNWKAEAHEPCRNPSRRPNEMNKRQKRFTARLAEEAGANEVCLWMSFCDTRKPKGEQFLGVVITRAKGIASAIEKTWALGINPGGEVMSYETDPSDIAAECFDRLLSKHELVKAGYCDA